MPNTTPFRMTWRACCSWLTPPLRSGRGLELPRVARTRLIVRDHRIDELAPLRRVAVGQEPDGRDPGEAGVAVELVAVGERELQRLGDGVDVLGYTFKHALTQDVRSEERRVGKECRSRWSPYH